ncbi:amidohydrolase family protein [Nocardioides sp.]|uniref:amidohydrolase family protein n=1 Tax=Nocardioides sp. TaxID=35761 RepID=UPI003784409C
MQADQPEGALTLALCGATVVVALDPPVVVSADVVLSGDRVVSLGVAPPGVPRRDCSDTVVVPGNVCAHHHLYSALSRGMPYRLAPPTSFVQILQRVWWRLDRALDDRAIRAAALRGGLDALRAGTTTIVDHHSSPNAIDGSLDIIAETLAELGVRSVLCYEVTDRDGPGRAAAGVAENRRFLARSSTARGLARGMVGAHASFTMSDATLAEVVEAARGGGVGVHIHVAEDRADQADAHARHGIGVVERLDGAGVLTGDALLAHCVHLAPAEVHAVVDTGATVVCNARSNMNNAVGHSPFNHVRPGADIGVALGTDGIGGDMVTESQVAYLRARAADAATGGGWPLERLTDGARFAGRVHGEPLLGTLRPGAPADLVVLDYPTPTPLTADNLAGHWTFGLSPAHVRDVVVAGELVVADRRSTRVDEIEVAADGAREAERLWVRTDAIAPHDFEPGGSRR